MQQVISTVGRIMSMTATVILLFAAQASAQVEKGSKEILLLTSDFFFDVDESGPPRSPFGDGTVFFSRGGRGFALSAEGGYFLTRKNEIGGGFRFTVNRFEFCNAVISDGRVVSEDCESDTNANLGLSGFYRFNFASERARGFPFVGAQISAASVSDNFTGNIALRPHAGYKYFFNRNVALDVSVGYRAELNKAGNTFFRSEREGRIDGQIGLAFVF